MEQHPVTHKSAIHAPPRPRLSDDPHVPSPRLTIGIVTLNAADVLEAALVSVLRHKCAALELVVMDGGSTDATLQILQRHDAGIDLWRSEPDAGIYDAMNKLLRAATGDWLLFLGADDELLASPQQLLQHCRHPDAVYYGDVRIRSSGQVSGGHFSRYRLMQQNICHQSVLYPRSVYKAKSYDVCCGLLADHRYNIEVMGGGTPFVHIPEVVSVFNDAGRSSTGDQQFEAIKLEAIHASFGWPLYTIKRLRTACVRLLKSAYVAA
jgi:glycosyltransferase involved in cell wall biosynthesis